MDILESIPLLSYVQIYTLRLPVLSIVQIHF